MLHSNEKQSRSKKTKNDEQIKTVIANLAVWPKISDWNTHKKRPSRAKVKTALPTRQPSKSIQLDCSKISFEGQVKKNLMSLKN